jgi:Predicted membrane protein (DUF2142)
VASTLWYPAPVRERFGAGVVTSAVRERFGAGIVSRLFPGDRRVWAAGSAVLIVAVAVVAFNLARSAEHYTGTNSVGVRSIVAEVEAGRRLCVPELRIPEGTARAELTALWGGSRKPRLLVERRTRGEPAFRGTEPPVEQTTGGLLLPVRVDIGEVPARAESVNSSLCVTPVGGNLSIGGTAGLQADQKSPVLAGKPIHSRVAVRFLPPIGEETSILSLLPEAFERAALFRPGIVAPWWYGAIFFLVLPALWFASLYTLATAATGNARVKRLAIAVAIVAFTNAAAWALITPAWQGPDEPDHFAYLQTLAEQGELPDRQPGGAGAFSSGSVVALDATRTYSTVALGDTKPPWLPYYEQRYREALAENPGAEDDGGGFLLSTSAHLPGYYGLTLPAYLAFDSQSTFSELTAARLISALLAGLAALCTFLTVRELAPRRPWLGVTAGLLVAFQPMVAFMFGVLNNDAGVNAGAALLVFLLIRGLRRGLTVPLGVGLGVTLALLTAMKGTGAALYPAAGVALIGMLWRRHARSDLPGYGAFAVIATLAYLVRRAVVSALEPAPIGTGPAVGADASNVIESVLDAPGVYLSYTWQMFLPRLWFMNDLHVQTWPAFEVFIKTGWAAFGWIVFRFPNWVYVVIVIVSLAAAALCAVAVLRRRRAALRLGWELATLLLVIAGVALGVEAAYFTNTPRPVPAEQGRYIFTAILPLAAVAAGACLAFQERTGVIVASVLVAGMMGLGYASQFLTLSGFFT